MKLKKKTTIKNKKKTIKNKNTTIKFKKNTTIKNKKKLSKIKKGGMDMTGYDVDLIDGKFTMIDETFIPFTMTNYQFNSVEISIEELINGLVLLRLVNSKSRPQLIELCDTIEELDIEQIMIMDNGEFPDIMTKKGKDKKMDIVVWNELGLDEWPFYYGMYIETPTTLFLLLRGTRNELAIDWSHNMDWTLVEFLGGEVHRGFLIIFQQYIQPHLDTIILNSMALNRDNLIICGYSLGSALAYITSFYISKIYPQAFTKVRILLYSLPPLGNRHLNRLYQMSSLYALNTINIIYNNDPLPYMGLPANALTKLHIPSNISVIIPDEEWFPWIRNPKKIIEYHKIKYFLPILKTLQKQSIILETTTNGDIFNLYQLPDYHLLLDNIGHNHILYFPILTYLGPQTIYFAKNNTNQVVLFIDNTIVIIDKIEILAEHIVRVFNLEYQQIITELNEQCSEPQLEEFQITFMVESNGDTEYILKCRLSNIPIVLHLMSILEIPDRVPFEFKTVQTHTTAIIYNKQANHTQTTHLPLLDINPDLLFISLQQHLILQPVSIDDGDEFVMVENENLSQYLEPEYGIFVIMVEYQLSQGKLYYLIDNHYLEISNIYLNFIESNMILNNDIVIPQDKVNILQLFDSLMELLMEDLLFPEPLYNCQNLILNYNQQSQLTYLPIYLGENTFIGFNETKQLFLLENNTLQLIADNTLQLIATPEILSKIPELPTYIIKVLNKYW